MEVLAYLESLTSGSRNITFSGVQFVLSSCMLRPCLRLVLPHNLVELKTAATYFIYNAAAAYAWDGGTISPTFSSRGMYEFETVNL